jgi:hypothetical protein
LLSDQVCKAEGDLGLSLAAHVQFSISVSLHQSTTSESPHVQDPTQESIRKMGTANQRKSNQTIAHDVAAVITIILPNFTIHIMLVLLPSNET